MALKTTAEGRWLSPPARETISGCRRRGNVVKRFTREIQGGPSLSARSCKQSVSNLIRGSSCGGASLSYPLWGASHDRLVFGEIGRTADHVDFPNDSSNGTETRWTRADKQHENRAPSYDILVCMSLGWSCCRIGNSNGSRSGKCYIRHREPRGTNPMSAP